ncbi:PfkB family carbohydrate kinase [Nocardia ninae]|uniref:Carbohydrate kinase PfkB domain-containing protein n=1 Tax=Nocardia ninae NBRC 108245 TaxID=1210091 RepID=A0A511MD12_9NOCA|nr:PfkB family carbohydrate kinase [Nocardia ninae]GEM38550.1 hypothetical protein NN4_30690 [Nocardia ninae NBRC 108245]
MNNPPGPVVCVSYLAYAELWTVPQFPRVNHGAPIRSIEQSVAADGPMTAAALASMGAPTRLIANNIGDDERGQFVRRWLSGRHVTLDSVSPDVVTPRIVVAADDDHTRTWFAHLPGVVASLEEADLAPVVEASVLYVDCYEIIEQAALRVIDAGRTAEVPMLLNLGGSDLSEAVTVAVAGYPHLLIQTNVDDADHLEAPGIAKSLLAATDARWVIVTAGSFGAVAVSSSEEVAMPAFPVNVLHTHCAGAAFSAGLLYGLRAGWPMERSMTLGSASGALRCARRQAEPLPNLADLQVAIASTSSDQHRIGA